MNKKTTLILLLSGILLLSACGAKVDRYGFFSESVLSENGISDLPQLPYGKENNTYTASHSFYCTLSYEEFQNYAEDIFEYLIDMDFEYFGYEDKESFNNIGTSANFIRGEKLSDFYFDNQTYEYQTYQFIWADEIYVNDDTKSLYQRKSLEILYYYESQEKEVDKEIFTYNVKVQLNGARLLYVVE